MDDDDIFCERCDCEERSDEEIKNALIYIPTLENINYVFRWTNERDLEWLSNMGCSNKRGWDRNSLIRDGKHTLEEIKDHNSHFLLDKDFSYNCIE